MKFFYLLLTLTAFVNVQRAEPDEEPNANDGLKWHPMDDELKSSLKTYTVEELANFNGENVN